MNNLTKDFIAVDTNVFEHLFNPEKNTNDHILYLIGRLRKDKIRLLIDGPREKSRIRGEYYDRLSPYVNSSLQRGRAESVLLRYFLLLPENSKVVNVNQKDDLMESIKGVIEVQKGKPVTDRFFVYVAFKKERVLVTNDSRDILSKRKELKGKAKKRRLEGADILSSQEAYERIADSNSAVEEPNHE